MKIKSIVLLAVAVGCGLVAMLGVQQVLSRQRAAAQQETGLVLTALTDITTGTKLTDANTKFKEFPLDSIPEGAVTKKEQYEERAVKVSAVAGEIIMQAKLGAKGDIGASMEIPPGMRVVTVSVNATKTHSGLILPGDRVDVLCTYKTRKGASGMISKTKTVLEYIKVFATDNVRDAMKNDSQEQNAKNISVLVTPDQANLLMLADSKGTLTLALRSMTDSAMAPGEEFDETALDETAALEGAMDENAEEGMETAEDGQSGDVRKFLEETQQETETTKTQETSTEVAANIQPKRPMWKIEIFAGDEKITEQFEMPEEAAHPAEQPGTTQPAQESGQKSWKGFWKMFKGA